jgi:PIN domain nuclease of toxin-antitoxin system
VSRLLVDTRALLWWLIDDPALSPTAREALADPANEPFVSAASAWEIAIKRSLGKLRVPDGLPEILAERGFRSLPVSAEHAWAARELPLHHRDPFDRMLIIQAMAEGAGLVTADAAFARYDVTVVW